MKKAQDELVKVLKGKTKIHKTELTKAGDQRKLCLHASSLWRHPVGNKVMEDIQVNYTVPLGATK